MKKMLLLTLATLFATSTFAQQQLATLNHNDSITVYYGASALQQAHAAAVNGDIITLSPGAFNSVNITKAITLRGAGMFPDTAAGTDPTILLNDFTLTINNDSLHSLYMEGINCSGSDMYCAIAYNPQFIKCYFREITISDNGTMQDATFINCVINRFNNVFGRATSTQFVNSIILDCGYRGNPTLINCVAKLDNAPSSINGVSVNNSIVYCDNYRTSVNAYTSFNSVGLYIGNDARDYFFYEGLPNHNLYNYRGFESVFKNFRGSYSDGITFELLDSVAATCLGNDGTQVGIYGGIMPFDPSVRNPLIKKCNVASRSTADGKLAVDIEIVSE